MGLAWSNDPERYAGGRVATGSASHDGQVKGDGPDKSGYPRPPGWGLEYKVTSLISVKFLISETPNTYRSQMDNSCTRSGKCYNYYDICIVIWSALGVSTPEI